MRVSGGSVRVGYVLRSPTGVRTRTSGAAFTCDDVRQEAEVHGLVRTERAVVIATAEPLQGNERGRLPSGSERDPLPAGEVAAVRWSACDSPSKYKCHVRCFRTPTWSGSGIWPLRRSCGERRQDYNGKRSSQSGGAELAPPTAHPAAGSKDRSDQRAD